MKVRLWSDVHLEFGDLPFTPRDDDKETVLVIAGDFQVGSNSFDFLREICPKFKAVVYTCGNHEYYGQVMQHVDTDLFRLTDEIANFHFLNPGVVVIDDVRFVGATLWTDLNNNDPVIMQCAKYMMNDYRKIKYKRSVESGDAYYPITPEITCTINRDHRNFICTVLDSPHAGKTVVFTHHPPLEECAKNKFYQADDPLTFAYCNTGLEPWIAKADYWFHGHVHNWVDIEHEGCRIIARPRGYHGYEECAFDYDKNNKNAEIIEL